MNVKEIIAIAREKLGIEQLTPMQHKMAGLSDSVKALALIAPTGSGKTLGYALALLRRMGESDGKIRGLVIAPSRELVLQIAKVMTALAPDLRIISLYGGHSVLDETRSLTSATPDIVVATPGRLLDHINRKRLDLRPVRVFVADEYDKSLELGFHDEMRRIASLLHRKELTILTSATPLPELPEWLGLTELMTLNFAERQALPKLNKWEVKSAEADKLFALKDLLLRLPQERTLVFVNHRESAERVHQFLRKNGFPSGLYHGALDQQERETAVDLFTNGSTPIMVATDLAARGLDIPQVRSIIHYHMPVSAETLTHRNGRAARMGATGDVYYIIGPQECCPESETKTYGGGTPREWDTPTATLYFHAGRKEKLSKGDILGALTGPGGLDGSRVGAISMHDHRALAAVPSNCVNDVAAALNASRIKARRIRVTIVNGQ